MHNRNKLISDFIDISSSSFPIDIKIRNKIKIYVQRINDFSKSLEDSNILNNYTFLEVESEMMRIRGSGNEIINNHLYHHIRDIFFFICSFHQNPTKYKEKTIKKWFIELSTELQKNNYFATYEFINWLVTDLKNGSAI